MELALAESALRAKGQMDTIVPTPILTSFLEFASLI
jgi:hypothetical protein